MRVLVISEGKHELNHKTGNSLVSGALVELVKRILNHPQAIENLSIERKDARSFGDITRQDRGTGGANYKRKAMSWIRRAENEKYDAIVIVVDQDNAPDRREGLDSAQEDARLSLPRAIGLAVKTFDAWMLADEKAISIAIGRTVQTQKSPEEHKSPKAQMETIIANCDGMSEVYLRIVKEAKIDTLCTRCPKGFRPFHDRVAKLVTPVR
jgi:hypothetical protein